ncbi:MAG: phosphatidate cytidylyltransferase [Elusimicrobia bacterium]|nr:phosphatidate cytidylyltransferase [Elusimicrobiota bacterium]
MLLPRILTAVIGIPIIIWIVHVGSLAYASFVLTVIGLSLYEYSILMQFAAKPVQRTVLFLFGMLIPATAVINNFTIEQIHRNNLLSLSITLCVVFSVVWELFSGKKSLERIGLTLTGIFLISWNLIHLMGIRNFPGGEGITFMMLFTVWTMDTAAYAAGRAFGKRQLSAVSPKKTWEGAAAGFIAAICMSLLLRIFMKDILTLTQALIIGVIIGLAGQVSDLAESMIKRAAGVKDSSNLLPGHGGILDRFDSYIFLAPLIYYFVLFTA